MTRGQVWCSDARGGSFSPPEFTVKLFSRPNVRLMRGASRYEGAQVELPSASCDQGLESSALALPHSFQSNGLPPPGASIQTVLTVSANAEVRSPVIEGVEVDVIHNKSAGWRRHNSREPLLLARPTCFKADVPANCPIMSRIDGGIPVSIKHWRIANRYERYEPTIEFFPCMISAMTEVHHAASAISNPKACMMSSERDGSSLHSALAVAAIWADVMRS